MSRSSANVVTLGELVAAACYAAETVTRDPALAAALASRTVARRLARTGRLDLARRLSGGARPAPSRPSGWHLQAA